MLFHIFTAWVFEGTFNISLESPFVSEESPQGSQTDRNPSRRCEMFCAVSLLAAFHVLAHLQTLTHGCQLPSEWRPLSEGCRAELAEIIVYARVLAIHQEPLGGGAGSLYNSLPFGFGYGYERAEEGLLYSAEVELLCDQAWGSMLEVPSGSRLNLTGLGYLSCQSHTVMENYSYFFFLR